MDHFAESVRQCETMLVQVVKLVQVIPSETKSDHVSPSECK
jgi:hypothetical protein